MRNVLRSSTALGLMLALAGVGLSPPVAAAPADRPGQAPPERPQQATAGQERRAEQVPGRYIVAYRSSVGDPHAKTSGLERARGFRADHRYSRALSGFAASLSDAQLAALEDDPDVAFVSPDRPVSTQGVVALAANESPPTGVRRMEAATTETTRQASTANVAVLDTGIDLDHPDLNAVHGTNCVGPGPAEDDHGHGTHVAGTVAALNNGTGVVGVAPGTRVHAVKVLDAKGSGSWSRIICGMDWVTATRTDGDPANDILVANLSLGGSGTAVGSCSSTSDALHRAICNSTAQGVTYVVAAGNNARDFDHPSTPDVPAAYPQVLTVAAAADTDGRPGGTGGAGCDSRQSDDTYASFSNYAATSAGAAHLIAAPGSCILSTRPGGAHTTMSGTSMAAPHMAGVVALCLGESGTPGPCAGLAPAQITDKIRTAAEARTTADAGYGFKGDPTRPVSGRTYGYLGWAGGAGPAPVEDPPPVDDAPPPTSAGAGTYQDDNPAITYTGAWSTVTNSKDSGGSVRYTTVAGRAAELQFSGTAIQWVARRLAKGGITEVFIDGTKVASVDLYSPTTQFQQVVFEQTGLADGPHTIRLVTTANKNPSSSNTIQLLDAFVVDASPVADAPPPADENPPPTGAGTYQDDNPAITYTGAWSTVTNSKDSGGSVRYTNVAGRAAELQFSGTAIQWVTRRLANGGITDVFIDGTKVASVDLYSPTKQFQQVVFEQTGLVDAPHTIRLVTTANKNPSSSNTIQMLDAFVVQ